MLELASTLSHRPRTPADRPIGGCGSGWSKQRQLVVGRRMVGSWLNISQTLVITHDVSVIFGENPKPGFEPRNLDFLGCNINPTFFMVASADGIYYILYIIYYILYIIYYILYIICYMLYIIYYTTILYIIYIYSKILYNCNQVEVTTQGACKNIANLGKTSWLGW